MFAKLYSAPEEYYLDHISRCKEKFNLVFPMFLPTVKRVFNFNSGDKILSESFLKMILFHDLGKLTKKWQENLGTNKRLPSHSPLGAAYLYKTLPDGILDDIRNAISFAVAIHHTDKGFLGDNIERPDVQAILDGILDNDGSVLWHEATITLEKDFFDDIAASNLKINDLKDMARGLRKWAKGCGLLEQHQRRLQASLAHHILKLCDISAATERKEYKKNNDQDYYGGWLMVEEIRRYVENVEQRGK